RQPLSEFVSVLGEQEVLPVIVCAIGIGLLNGRQSCTVNRGLQVARFTERERENVPEQVLAVLPSRQIAVRAAPEQTPAYRHQMLAARPNQVVQYFPGIVDVLVGGE